MNPYVRGSSETYYYQYIFNAYQDPAMLWYSSSKQLEFSANKKSFEEDVAQVAQVFDRPYESLGYTEIHNHTFSTIKCNNQDIAPGMTALFAAIFKKNFPHTLKMDPNTKPIFRICDDVIKGIYPQYIKKDFLCMNNSNFMEPNKYTVLVIKKPDKESTEALLTLLNYCKEGKEHGFPINKNDGHRYYNPENELFKVYERFERDPELFEEDLDIALLTCEVSQTVISETTKKTKLAHEDDQTSKKLKV